MNTEWTTCKKCNRVVWVEDVDADGMCCYCEKPKKKEKAKEKETHFYGSTIPSLAED